MLLRQIAALITKDLKIVTQRRWLSTFLRSLALPVCFIIFLAYARNFFLPPSEYGFGIARPIRDLTTEVFNNGSTSLGGRDRVVFINGGHDNGQIDTLIERLSVPLRAVGVDVRLLRNEDQLSEICPSSLSGATRCYASASFKGSPTEGRRRRWSYTARIDASLAASVFVSRDDNAAQVYVLPFIQAIDAEIARIDGNELPAQMLEQPFTYETIQDREDDVQQYFMSALRHYLAVTLFIAICGIVFHLPGYIAVERESGLASLVDVMSQKRWPWTPLIARVASSYLSFALVYLPGWLAIGAVVSELIFTRTGAAIVIPFHILLGLSLAGYSLLFGSFFKKSQLSGVTALIFSLALAVVAQFAPRTRVTSIILGILFPPATYTLFAIELASSEQLLMGGQLGSAPQWSETGLPGYIFFIFLVVQIVAFPVLAALVQWWIHGTSRGAVRQLDDKAFALRLANVSKTYRSFWRSCTLSSTGETVRAVDDLTLDIVRGQLVTLLGVNGSGKSTLLAGITGTQAFSKGTIELAKDTTIGFCPQRNVAWSDLAVQENVKVFTKLKTTSSANHDTEDIRDLICACGLEEKLKAKPKALSGGMQRKLQLALAFTGGSKVCCIDEASSGLDPLSRRKIWEILLAERGQRTILLTTHALDEADALSDHIAIMARGRLVSEGSCAEIKERHAGGFNITARAIDRQRSDGSATSVAPTIFTAPNIDGLRGAVEQFEAAGKFNIDIRSGTVEDAFLQLAGNNDGITKPTLSTEVETESRISEKGAYASSPGKGTTFIQQVLILFRKRLVVFRRNYTPYLCTLAIPAVVTGLGCYFFLSGFDGIPCSSRIGNNPELLTLGALERYWGILIPIGPRNRFSIPALLPAYYRSYSNRLHPVSDFDEYQAYIHTNFRDVAPGGFYLGNNDTATPLLSYRINGSPGYAGLAKNLADSYLLNTAINVQFSTFALPFLGSTGDSLQLILYITLGLCVYPAFLALYPTFERVKNVRALHYSSGVRPGPLWLAYLLFDGIAVLLVSIVVVVLLTSLSSAWFAPGYLFMALFLYGICSTLLAYVASLFCDTVLGSFAVVAGYQAPTILKDFNANYFVLYLVMLTFGSAEQLRHNLNVVQFTYGLICPAGSLLRSLLLALNQSQLLCRERSFATNPGSLSIYGGPYLYLILQSVALYTSLVCYDTYSWTTIVERFRTMPGPMDPEKDSQLQQSSVRKESERTRSAHDELRLLDVSKRFGKELVVDNVTFSVDRGEILALLGPNGAGKTTTIGLIRGDLQPSSPVSTTLISDHNIQRDKLAAHRHLGVCPQFNATDRMTVTEHLKFYARIRGIQEVSQRVEGAVVAFGLFEYRRRLVSKLSGGNQRRLSLATAMVGNPSVVLLDEPSTGMDALAMRKMWQVINNTKARVAVVITTHSMEEASVLSDKVAIMNKRILTVGSPNELRDNYATGVYLLHIVHSRGSTTSAREMDDILDWLVQACPGARLQRGGDSSMHGQVRCQIVLGNAARAPSGNQRSSLPLLTLFECLEEAKQKFGVAYYSVSKPTLEDVFLDVLESHA